MNGLDLFSGIGGIGIALEPWVRTVAYCERDRYAQGVLLSRMRSGEIDTAPIWDDVTTLRADMLPRIDIIFGGFPCQDLSVAKQNREGLDGERSGLFFHIVRLARESRPAFVFLENVTAIRTVGAERVVKELAGIGYDCRWTTLSAASVGAPHRRDRWFLLAHPKRERCIEGADESGRGKKRRSSDQPSDSSKASRTVAGISTETRNQWSTESSVLRVAHGIPNRMDRIRCLGNSVVSLQVRTAFQKLAGVSL